MAANPTFYNHHSLTILLLSVNFVDTIFSTHACDWHTPTHKMYCVTCHMTYPACSVVNYFISNVKRDSETFHTEHSWTTFDNTVLREAKTTVIKHNHFLRSFYGQNLFHSDLRFLQLPENELVEARL